MKKKTHRLSAKGLLLKGTAIFRRIFLLVFALSAIANIPNYILTFLLPDEVELSLLVTALLGLMIGGAITTVVQRGRRDQATSLGGALQSIREKIGGLLVAGVIQIGTGIGLVAVGYYLLGKLNPLAEFFGVLGLWSAVLLLWARVCLATPAIVTENIGGLAGIRRSLELTSDGRWNHVGGAIFTITLVGALLLFLVSLAFGEVVGAELLQTGEAMLVAMLGALAWGTLLGAWTGTVMANSYFEIQAHRP